jgi:hypothetical protein
MQLLVKGNHHGVCLTLSLMTKDIKLYLKTMRCVGNVKGEVTHGNDKASKEGI